jgi:hypothetical protein
VIKKLLTFQLCLIAAILPTYAGLTPPESTNPYDLEDGDIVFQGGNDLQAKAVKAATHAPWSHVGIVFFYQNEPWVLEAIEPVQTTKLKTFIARCPQHFYAMRLKNSGFHINAKSIRKAEQYAKRLLGKHYDPHFQWSEDKFYCSELVWKIYKQATGIELCPPRLLSSYDLYQPAMQKLIKQRFHTMSNLPMNELMVAPADIARSTYLVEAPRKDGKITKK